MATTEHDIAGVVGTDDERYSREPSPRSTAAVPAHPVAQGTSTDEHDNALPPRKPWSLGPIRAEKRRQWQADNRRWLQEKRDEDPRVEFQRSFEVLPGSRYLVHNRTPYLIRLVQDDEPEFGELLLPPFAERVVKGARLRPFEGQLKTHRQRHEVFVRRHEERVSTYDKLITLVWLAVIGLVGVTVFDVIAHGTLRRPEFFGGAIATAVIVLLVLATAAYQEARRKQNAAATATEAGDVAFGIGGAYSDGNETARQAQHLLTLGLVLTVGMVMPVATILFATDTHEFLTLEGGLSVLENRESRLVSRLIQITYTVILSLFPALLYFQFDRQRAGTLRANWVRNLFRMDSRMRTIADVNATYGTAMYEASSNSDDSVRMLGSKNSPIVVATILISLGWTILVIRTESYDFQRTTQAAVATEVAEKSADQATEAADAAVAAEAEGDTATADAAAASAAAAAETAASAENAAADIADASTSAGGDDDTTSGDDGSAPTGDDDTTTGDDSGTTSGDDGSAPTGDDDTTTGDDGGTTSGAEPPAEESPPAEGNAADSAKAAADQAGQAVDSARTAEAVISSTSFFQVLAPSPSASGMAFLGAYFFGVYLILRSYFRGDLRAKLYNQVTARLVTVVVVAYLINATLFDSGWTETAVWVLAFLAGVVPNTAVEYVLKSVGGSLGRRAGGRFTPTRPLEHIDGVDIYDSSRLESEGIPDVAALANSDLATLMITTRLPIGRLVDWADQAALMVVVSPGTPRELDRRIWALRSRGVRTGTDMLTAIEEGRDLDAIQKCLRLDPERGSDGIADDAPDDAVAGAGQPTADQPSPPVEADGAPEDPNANVTAMDPTPVIRQEADLTELAEAIRRQPVMRQILQWRSSPLDEIDKVWIELPEFGTLPEPSEIYRGPHPDPDGYRTRAEAQRA